MDKYKYDETGGLWYELKGDYYFPCLTLPESENKPIGLWGQRHKSYLQEWMFFLIIQAALWLR